MLNRLRYYMGGQSAGLGRYILEQFLLASLGWIPSIVGIGLRAIFYKLILKSEGFPAIECGVRLAYPSNIVLGRNVYLDQGVYLHACPQGIVIGDNTFVMHHAELHVYNFRGLPHAGIRIGRECIIGEFNVIRGPGGVTIGDQVLTAPCVQILSSNHIYEDPNRPIIEQGVTAEGIIIEDGAWIGAGAVILDGVTVGKNSVIGAGAVVTKNVPPYSLALGAPAEVVRDLREGKGRKGNKEDRNLMPSVAKVLRGEADEQSRSRDGLDSSL